ncbi:hypothetical protein ACIRF8_05910 [Streptomyces sp. NPDC102406]|uniref:hypothetical protein n=1 Tax=Streptomyces sp. NPDC102406 TaxID=3366171 RepID=UPI00382D9C39
MTGSNSGNTGTETVERTEAGASGHGRHRGAVTMSSAHGEQSEPRGRHRGPRADEA